MPGLPRLLRLPSSVLGAWLVSRAIVAAALVFVQIEGGGRFAQPFIAWDGGWYAAIAEQGYGFAQAGGKTPYPFFPLLPAVLAAGAHAGIPYVVTGAVLSHLALLAALAGLHELVRSRFSSTAAGLAVWSLALFPGSAPLSMVYPESVFLALTVWAFVALDRRSPHLAGALAGVAALTRPNGLATAASLVVAGLGERKALSDDELSIPEKLADLAWTVLPAAAACAAWMGVLWLWTGDPLAFVTAKNQWDEWTLGRIVAGEVPLPTIDVGAGVIALAALVATCRRLPPAWLFLSGLWLLPPFFLGVLGMPRYVSSCFPVFAALGLLLTRLPLALVVLGFAASGGMLVTFAVRIGSGRMMP